MHFEWLRVYTSQSVHSHFSVQGAGPCLLRMAVVLSPSMKRLPCPQKIKLILLYPLLISASMLPVQLIHKEVENKTLKAVLILKKDLAHKVT